MKNLKFIMFLFFVLSVILPSGLRAQSPKEKPTVGILIFDNVQIIDYTGPYEVFMAAGYKVVTIAPEKKIITTVGNMKVTPDYDFSDAPKLDILLLPGGGRSGINDLEGVWKNAPLPLKDSPETMNWIRGTAENARFVLSVCNGAFTLARAGLLENKSAVTTMPFLKKLKEVSPSTNVIFDKRWADNGKIISSGGLSAGIDASLHVVEKMNSRGKAQDVALAMEYNWEADGNYSSFALARKYTMFGFDIEAESLSRQGDEDHWENSWLVSKPATIPEILEVASKTLSEKSTYGPVTVKWERSSESKPNASLWNFTDEKGNKWHGLASVEASPGDTGKFIFSIKAARDGSSFAKLLQ